MRYFLCGVSCFVLAGTSMAQSFRPDWHTGDYEGRNPAMWKVISEDLKTSFPRGGGLRILVPADLGQRLDKTATRGDRGVLRGERASLQSPPSVLISQRCSTAPLLCGVHVMRSRTVPA